MTEDKKLVVELNEELAKVISELAKNTKKDVNEVVAELLSSSINRLSKLAEEDEEDEVEQVIKDVKSTSDFIKEAKEMMLLKSLSSDSEEKMLYKILNRNMLMTMLLYQQQTLQNLMRNLMRQQNSEEVENKKTLKLITKLTKEIKSLSEKQPELAKELSKAVAKIIKRLEKRKEKEALEEKFSKQIEELKKIIEAKEKEAERKALEEKFSQVTNEIKKVNDALNERIRYLESALAYASENQREDLLTQLQKLKQLREQIRELADVLGIAQKQPITTKEGKVDWGALLNNVLDTIRDLGKTALQKPPTPQQIQKLPEYSENFQQFNVEQELKKTEETIKEVEQKIQQISQEVKPEEKKEETQPAQETKEETQPVQETKVETTQETEMKVEETKEESSNQQVVTDDNIKVPNYPFLTLGDIKKKLGTNDVVLENGQVKVKRGDTWMTLSQSQLDELETEALREKLEKGEIKYNVGYKSFDELLQDERTLEAAYKFATAGTRIVLTDGTDVTDKVLEEGKKRGYLSFEETAKQYGGQTQEASS